jgi:hypothetical protein
MDANAIPLQTSDTGSITIHANVAIAGDYNADGSVGPEDYQLWRSRFGASSSPVADGSGNHIVDAADYVLWRKNLGNGSSAATSPAPSFTVDSVPEPDTILLLVSAVSGFLALGRRLR